MNSGIFARLCFLLACIGLSGQASAWIAVNPGAASVSTIVSGNAGRWDYSYSVTNMTTCATGQCETGTILGIPVSDQLRLVQFVVPYFTDYNLSNVVAPANWTWHIDTTDTNHLENIVIGMRECLDEMQENDRRTKARSCSP